jgi:hypothetical protein
MVLALHLCRALQLLLSVAVDSEYVNLNYYANISFRHR